MPGVEEPFQFEGPEKRFEINFSKGGRQGLRDITRPVWDLMMDEAKCTIVSVLNNDHCDAYLLSESSLFVYDDKLMIKTCGTTALLHMVPRLLFEAGKLDLHVDWVQFSRSNLNKPDKQPEVHQHFDHEVSYLQQYFPEGKAFVLGPLHAGYHLFVADYNTSAPAELTQQTFEVIMNDLDPEVMKHYFQDQSATALEARVNSGIPNTMPKAVIDDFLFEPCGYSLNSLEGDAYYTIHITPESGFSYVSFETNVVMEDYSPLLRTVVETFRPGKFCATVFCDLGSRCRDAGLNLDLPGYERMESSNTTLLDQSLAYFCNFRHTRNFSPKPKPKHCNTVVTPASVIAAMDEVRAQFPVERLESSLRSFCTRKAEEVGDPDSSFFVCDLNRVADKYLEWREQLPRVKPHYAVKCNPDKAIVKLLHRLGAGFDCASSAEIEQCLSLGVQPDDIVYANPCKLKKHITHAATTGVKLMTFDNVAELHKISQLYPGAHLILRLTVNDEKSVCRMSTKYGARKEDIASLLETAATLKLKLVGCSFHVGSNCTETNIFEEPLRLAAAVFTEGSKHGFSMDVLDIGGGFPGTDEGAVRFADIAKNIRPVLDELFPPSVSIIAEPGRFFARSAMNLVTTVFGKRADGDRRTYYINDGVYGSFNCKMYDHVDPNLIKATPIYLNGKKAAAGGRTFNTAVFGPTCDGLDHVLDDVQLPELENGDGIMFSNMGAYTIAAATQFNGFLMPKVFYCNSGVHIYP